MTFGTVTGKYLTLKQRLAVHVGAGALADITLLPPSGSQDELSFLRLVAWAYVLLYETGKVPLNFLKELPPASFSGELLTYVRPLRTWISHNLSLDKDHDLEMIKAASAWFKRTCGTGTPMTAAHWQACFTKICEELATLLSNAITACDALDSEQDGPRLIEELKRRLDRKWEAYRFDKYVQAATARLGYSGIEIVSFRQRYLERWRQVVATAEDAAIERLLMLRIEADLLSAMANALPMSSQELLQNLKLDGPRELAAAILVIRHCGKSREASLPELLQSVFNSLNSPPSA